MTEAGDYQETFKTINGCDSIVHLTLKVLGIEEDAVGVKIFRGESYSIGNQQFRDEGDYDVSLMSSQGCDSLVRLHLDYYQVYFPNVFSPNEDGRNDRFSIFGSNELREIRNLMVFDRWGAMLHSKDDLFVNDSEGWDGRSQGKLVNVGVYAYQATLLMNDGIERNIKGTVLLVR